jgi:hypothetical protein
MSIDSMASTHSTIRSVPDRGEDVARDVQYHGASDLTAAQGVAGESTAVQGMVGAAMVGLLGGGPRLAIRAARVVLAEGYSSRYSSRQGRLRRRTRRRGD